MNKIELAKIASAVAHCGQKYSSQHDYTYHLQKVYDVLVRFGYNDENLLCAAYLHDTVEDRNLKLKLIEDIFGEEVASIVWHVTNEGGRNRKEKNQKTLPKTAQNPQAIVLKLADRIANCEEGGLNDMYKKEHSIFKYILYREEHKAMWNHLDSLLGVSDA